MANIKTLLDLRRAKSDGTFNIIFRIIDFKKVYTINSGVALQQHYWDERKGQVDKTHPNAKLLNIKLSKHFFKIEQAVLSLDDEFSIDKLKAILSGKPQVEAPKTFQVFADKIIQQMKERDIFEFIEIWYNRKRRHSALDYKTIEEFWKQKNNFKNVALLVLRVLLAYPISYQIINYSINYRGCL